jgi:hypothetical protein
MQKSLIEKSSWQVFNYLFHPLFIPLYTTCYLLFYNTNLFALNTQVAKTSLLINVVLSLIFLQAFAVFLLKQLGFINSIYLKTQRERIAPIFIYTIFTFFVWAFVLLKNPANQTSFTFDKEASSTLLKNAVYYPKIAVRMGLAFFIASSITLICNSFYKISLHMIGVGLLLGITIVGTVNNNAHYGFIIMATLIVMGVLGARLKTSNHTTFELYSGFMLGLLSMLLCQFIG